MARRLEASLESMLRGTGVDIVELERIKRAVDRWGDAFLRRVYTEGELDYCAGGGRRRIEKLAARFAAKEAVLKALGIGLRDGLRWTDIEVVNNALGAPSIRLWGGALRKAQEQNITQVHIALSHSRQFAVATAHATASREAGESACES